MMRITGRMFHQVKMVSPNPRTCPVSCSVMFAELPGVETARAMEDESPLAHKTGHDRGDDEPEAPVDGAGYRGDHDRQRQRLPLVLGLGSQPVQKARDRRGLGHHVAGQQDERHLQRERQYAPQPLVPGSDQVEDIRCDEDGCQQGGDQGKHDGEQESIRQIALGQPDKEAYDPVPRSGAFGSAYPLLHISSSRLVANPNIFARVAFLTVNAPGATPPPALSATHYLPSTPAGFGPRVSSKAPHFPTVEPVL